MKKLVIVMGCAAVASALSACSYKDNRTVSNPPAHSTTVVQPVAPSTVNCAHGYDASTNTCY